MQKKGSDVHASLLHRVRKQRGQRIYDDSYHAEDDHRPTCDLWRGEQAHAALIDQVDADEYQGGVVNESRHNLDASVPVCHACIGGLASDFSCYEGNGQ